MTNNQPVINGHHTSSDHTVTNQNGPACHSVTGQNGPNSHIVTGSNGQSASSNLDGQGADHKASAKLDQTKAGEPYI